jgi:hypothetical protein
MPMLRRLRRIVALSIVSTAALFAGPAVALADCMAPPPFDEAVKTADIILVGTVTATINGNRWATVAVEEIWRGPDLPVALQIKGGPDANAASSVDRAFEVGQRYVFFPYFEADSEPLPGVPAGALADNSCTSTQVWNDELAAFRPADARLGEVGTTGDVMPVDLGFIAGIGGVLLVVVAVMLGVGLLARGRSD